MMMQNEYPYRVVLADDYVEFRNCLKRLIRQYDIQVVGEAGDGLQLIESLKVLPLAPHMAIIDISMPHLGGFEATSEIRKIYPGMKVLILSMHKEREYVSQSVSVGADGYIIKDDLHSELLHAIEEIRKGGVYFPSLEFAPLHS